MDSFPVFDLCQFLQYSATWNSWTFGILNVKVHELNITKIMHVAKPIKGFSSNSKSILSETSDMIRVHTVSPYRVFTAKKSNRNGREIGI